MTGPSLRASGVLEDVRISEPYSIYDRFDFGIPVGTYGDCWDRYYVRVEEMRQSLKIIEQAMQQMEPGSTAASVRRIARPPKGEVYLRTESPRGDFGVYLVSDGERQAISCESKGAILRHPSGPASHAANRLCGRRGRHSGLHRYRHG